MHTFAEKQKLTQSNESTDLKSPVRTAFGQNHPVHSISHLQRTIGNRAERSLRQTDAEDFQAGPATSLSRRSGHDFSRIPARSGRATESSSTREPEKKTGPTSDTVPDPAPTPPASPPSTPASPPSKTPPATPPATTTCNIFSTALASTPDGTSNRRTEVGVNEEVAMAVATSATWAASTGAVSPTTGNAVVWTAPDADGASTVTATPAQGSPCSISMNVVAPSSRTLVKHRNRVYDNDLAGSGFIADATILPTNVSFGRTEVQEGEALADADGYYDTVLHLKGKKHNATAWTLADPNKVLLRDGVGAPEPGTPGPFSRGNFSWEIPQLYRLAGSTGKGTVYSKALHTQEMFGPSGAEITDKEGAAWGRRPKP
jgi:hypothetical protein